jgi:hypothetical protein
MAIGNQAAKAAVERERRVMLEEVMKASLGSVDQNMLKCFVLSST